MNHLTKYNNFFFKAKRFIDLFVLLLLGCKTLAAEWATEQEIMEEVLEEIPRF